MAKKARQYFCQHCGSKCAVEVKTHYFDHKTGKPVQSFWATCPNVERPHGFWAWLFSETKHTDSYRFEGYDPDPDCDCSMGI